ncbi:MAG: hypothetical protein Q4D79_12575 [Propionibacteriaceae bacterium]|nr:hypothetical protein [Propionibacteriaceae bacterium]
MTLIDALTDFALLALEGQEALRDYVGEGSAWRADLAQRRLWVGQHEFEVALIGTSSNENNTWLWAWANPQYGPSDPVVAPIMAGIDKGRQAGIPEFEAQGFSLEGVPDYGMWPGSGVACAAAHMAGAPATYAGPYDQGVAYFAVLDFKLPAPDPITLPRLAMTAGAYSRDSRQTVGTYGVFRSLNPVNTDDGGMALTFPDGAVVTFSFDRYGRIAHVEGRMSAMN